VAGLRASTVRDSERTPSRTVTLGLKLGGCQSRARGLARDSDSEAAQASGTILATWQGWVRPGPGPHGPTVKATKAVTASPDPGLGRRCTPRRTVADSDATAATASESAVSH
jgi:hypothetical protein